MRGIGEQPWRDYAHRALAKIKPPASVSLIIAYYRAPIMLRRQYEAIGALPDTLKRALEVIIVDDGSPADQMAFPPDRALGVDLKIFRHLVDVRWNQDACRNLGVEKAKSNWILLLDMDHLVTASALWRIMFGRLRSDCAYEFMRVCLSKLDRCRPHPNMWFMSRDLFLSIGGYDERFAGWYGSDRDFRSRLRNKARVVRLYQRLIQVTPDAIADASTSQYDRLTPADSEALTRITAEREASGQGPIRQNFPYERVF